MDKINSVLKRMDEVARATEKSSTLWDVIDEYRAKFKDSPNIMGVSASNEAMAKILRDAINKGEPISDKQWYDKLGIEPPPPGALT